MGGTKVTDEGLKNIERFAKLKKLSLFRTAVSDEGLKSLEKLTSLETNCCSTLQRSNVLPRSHVSSLLTLKNLVSELKA